MAELGCVVFLDVWYSIGVWGLSWGWRLKEVEDMELRLVVDGGDGFGLGWERSWAWDEHGGREKQEWFGVLGLEVYVSFWMWYWKRRDWGRLGDLVVVVLLV